MNQVDNEFQRSGTPPVRYHLRYAKADELGHLGSLCRKSKAHWGYDETFLDKANTELRIPLTNVLANQVLVADTNKGIVGVGGVEKTGDREFTVSHLFVDPPYFELGIGKSLFTGIAALAAGLGGELLTIVSDPNATRFYEKMGAKLVGEERSASETGRMLPLLHYPLQS